MKVLQIILGVLVAIVGVYCCTYPVATQVSIAGFFVIAMGFGMLVGGIGEIVNWNDGRKEGTSSGWTLLGGIVSIVLGVLLLGCNFLASGIVYATFCAYILCIWLIVGGISRIGAALSLRNLQHNIVVGRRFSSGSWVLVLVLGILMIVAGVCCFGAPAILIGFMGTVFGVSMVIGGISLACLAIASPAK